MRALSLVTVALAACASPDRVLIVISGDAPGATEIEIVMAEPFVAKRMQRVDAVSPTTGEPLPPEPAFYIAQRASLTFEIDAAEPLDGTRLQIEVPGREPFVPIAIARDASGQIVGLGAYRADMLYADGIVPAAELIADVTVHELTIEPVSERTEMDVGIPAGKVARVACDGVPSGLAWRRGKPADNKPQLRIVLPFGDPAGSALDRLDQGADLDCDGSTPGVGGLVSARDDGDKRDCNDLDDAVTPGSPEVCNGREDNCDLADQGGLHVNMDGTCPAEPGCPSISLCDESRPNSGQICPAHQGCTGQFECRIPFQLDMAAMKACNAVKGTFDTSTTGACANGCKVTLVQMDSRWDIKIGVVDPQSGLYETVSVGPTDTLAIESVTGTTFAMGDDTGTFTLLVEQGAAAPVLFTIRLDLTKRPVMDCGDVQEAYVCGLSI